MLGRVQTKKLGDGPGQGLRVAGGRQRRMAVNYRKTGTGDLRGHVATQTDVEPMQVTSMQHQCGHWI